MSRDVTSDKWLSRSLGAAAALEAPQHERLTESQAPPPVPEPPGLGTVKPLLEAAAPTSFFSTCGWDVISCLTSATKLRNDVSEPTFGCLAITESDLENGAGLSQISVRKRDGNGPETLIFSR